MGKLLLSPFSLGEYCGSGAVRCVNCRSLRRRVQFSCTVASFGFDRYFLRSAMFGKAQAVTRLHNDREAARPPGFCETRGDVSPLSNAFSGLPGVYADLEVLLHAMTGVPRGFDLCGFYYSDAVDLRGLIQLHDPRDAYIFPFTGPCSLVSFDWVFDRRPSCASFEVMERYSRCQRGLSVAQGSPPTSSFTLGCPQASQAASLSLQGIGESRCLRGLSVAQGSPPATSFAVSVDALRASIQMQCLSTWGDIGKSCFEMLSLFILWCGAFVVPCMRSLSLCLLVSLLAALRRSVSVRLLPVRRTRRIMLAGTDLWPLRSLGVIASPCHQPILTWAPYRTHAKGCKPCNRPVPKQGFLYRLLVHLCVTYLYGTLPCCVWAAPKGISNLQSVSEVNAGRVPEALPDTANSNLGSLGPPASCARAGEETWSDTIARMQDQALYDAFAERLDPPCLRFRFLQPGFPDEVTALRNLPAHPDQALQEAMLTLPATRQCQPLMPIEAEAQPWPGVITVALVPPWVPNSTWATIILDLTDIGGPLFSEFVPVLLTFRDLAVFADVYTQQDWEVFKAGEDEPLANGSTRVVASGHTFTFVYAGRPPSWHAGLASEIRSRRSWVRTPPIAPPAMAPHEWLVVLATRRIAVHHTLGDGPALRAIVAEMIQRSPDHVSFGSPRSCGALVDVRFQGRPVIGILAAEPRSESIPPGPNLGAFVFLDARRIAHGISCIFAEPGPHSISHIFRLLGARPPSGYVPLVVGVGVEESHVDVADGEVIVLEYAEVSSSQPVLAPDPVETEHSLSASLGVDPSINASTGGVSSLSAIPPPILRVGQDALDHAIFDAVSLSGGGGAFLSSEETNSTNAGLGVDINAWFVGFAPQHTPEYVGVTLAFPLSADEAGEAVAAARCIEQACTFEYMCIVVPQPWTTCAAFLSLPAWASDRPYVLVDSSRVDNRCFGWLVDPVMQWASFVQQVAVDTVPGLRICVAGTEVPRHSPLHFTQGDLVILLRPDQPRPQLLSLDELLQFPAYWSPQRPLSVNNAAPGFRVLTDGGERLVRFRPRPHTGAEDFRATVADLCQYPLYRTVVMPTAPRITDALYQGFPCHGVVLASAQLPYLPVPPGRLLPEDTIFFVDLRPILQGFQSRCASRGKIDLQTLEQHFADGLPADHTVFIHGGRTELEGNATVLYLQEREVLRVEFCRNEHERPPSGETSDADSSSSSSSSSGG